MNKRIAIVASILFGIFMFAGCAEGVTKAETTEQKSGQENYNHLASQDPALNGKYSSTRKTINFFTETWLMKPKQAYLYLMNNEGTVIGYYVLDGPPVSMCTSLRPPYRFVGTPDDGSDALDQKVAAPGTDGAFYSGGECNTYYGKDAATGAYIQYTAGQGINPLLYSEPLAAGIVGGAPNLGKVGR